MSVVYLRKFFQLSVLTFLLTCIILMRKQELDYSTSVEKQIFHQNFNDKSIISVLQPRIDGQDFHIGRSLDGLKQDEKESFYDSISEELIPVTSFPTGTTQVSRHLPEFEPTETPTQLPRDTELKDVFISVKTTQKFHSTRVQLLLDTWATIARDQTYFFTDANDEKLSSRTNGHVINTNCSQGHNRRDLCCKMAFEFDYFLASRKRWFCHADDDTYVNVRRLVHVLRAYVHTRDWYLGKPSLTKPVYMDDNQMPGSKVSFWFATGGAGFCISRSLALKMAPHASGGRLKGVCEKIGLPDDCSIGYIINHLLSVDLTVVPDFHSHLERLRHLTPAHLSKHITLSYAPHGKTMNAVSVSGFDIKADPTRFRSIHCKLYPNLKECRSRL